MELPERGNSTPVIWGDRVFITQSIEREGSRLVLCFDKRKGRPLWRSGTVQKEPEQTHPTNPYCSASPVTDASSFGDTSTFFALASKGDGAFDERDESADVLRPRR